MSDAYRVKSVLCSNLDGTYVLVPGTDHQFAHTNGVYNLSRDSAKYWLFTIGKAKGGIVLLKSTSARIQPIGLTWVSSSQNIESNMTITFARPPEAPLSASIFSSNKEGTQALLMRGDSSKYLVPSRRAVTPNAPLRGTTSGSSCVARSGSNVRPSTAGSVEPIWAPNPSPRLAHQISAADRYKSSQNSIHGGSDAFTVTTAAKSRRDALDQPGTRASVNLVSESALWSPSSADKPPAPALRASTISDSSSSKQGNYYSPTSSLDSTRLSSKYEKKHDSTSDLPTLTRSPAATTATYERSMDSTVVHHGDRSTSAAKLKKPTPSDRVDIGNLGSHSRQKAATEKTKEERLDALARTFQQYTEAGEFKSPGTGAAAGEEFWSTRYSDKHASPGLVSTPPSAQSSHASPVAANSPLTYNTAKPKPNSSTNMVSPVSKTTLSNSGGSQQSPSQSSSFESRRVSERCAELLARSMAHVEEVNAYLLKQSTPPPYKSPSASSVTEYSYQYSPLARSSSSRAPNEAAPAPSVHDESPATRIVGSSTYKFHFSTVHEGVDDVAAQMSTTTLLSTAPSLRKAPAEQGVPPPLPTAANPNSGEYKQLLTSAEEREFADAGMDGPGTPLAASLPVLDSQAPLQGATSAGRVNSADMKAQGHTAVTSSVSKSAATKVVIPASLVYVNQPTGHESLPTPPPLTCDASALHSMSSAPHVSVPPDWPEPEISPLTMGDFFNNKDASNTGTETESEVEDEAIVKRAVAGRPAPSPAAPRITFSPRSLASKLQAVQRAVQAQIDASREAAPAPGIADMDKSRICSCVVEGFGGNKIELHVPDQYCADHNKEMTSSRRVTDDGWEPLWTSTMQALDRELSEGQAQLQLMASAAHTHTLELAALQDALFSREAQLLVSGEEERAAQQRAANLLAKHGGTGHVKLEQSAGTVDFPNGTQFCAEFEAALKNVESFALDTAAESPDASSESERLGEFVQRVLCPMFAVAQQFVEDQLDAKRDVLRGDFGTLLPADPTSSPDSIPLQYWYASLQKCVPREISQLSDAAVEKILHSAGSSGARIRQMMQAVGARGDAGGDLTLTALLRLMLRLHTVAALSDPRCFLHPAPGARLPYKEGLHQEILSPGVKQHGRIKEGDTVEVVLPGLYFDEPTSEARPMVRSFVRSL